MSPLRSTRLGTLPFILVLLHVPLAVAYCLTSLPGEGRSLILKNLVEVIDAPAVLLAWLLTFDSAADWAQRGAPRLIWLLCVVGAGGVQWYIVGRLIDASRRSRLSPRFPVPLYRRRGPVRGTAIAVRNAISHVFVFAISFWFVATVVENSTSRQAASLPLSVAFGFAVCATVVNVLVLRRRRRGAFETARVKLLEEGLCPICGYDLTGLPSNRCPECGREFPAWAQRSSLAKSCGSSQGDG